MDTQAKPKPVEGLMLSEENKLKLATAIKVLEDLINFLDGAPIDPRAVTLMDIAASYLEEQKENNIEYHEHNHDIEMEDGEENEEGIINEEQTVSAAPLSLDNMKEYVQSLENLIKYSPGEENFKFLKPTQKTPPSPQAPLPMADGDSIAEEIQEWYRQGEPEDWGR